MTQKKRPTAAEPRLSPLAVAVRRVLSSQRFAANDARFDTSANTLGITAFSPTYKSYDTHANGLIETKTDPEGHAVSFGYNFINQLKHAIDQDGVGIKQTHNYDSKTKEHVGWAESSKPNKQVNRSNEMEVK